MGGVGGRGVKVSDCRESFPGKREGLVDAAGAVKCCRGRNCRAPAAILWVAEKGNTGK